MFVLVSTSSCYTNQAPLDNTGVSSEAWFELQLLADTKATVAFLHSEVPIQEENMLATLFWVGGGQPQHTAIF